MAPRKRKALTDLDADSDPSVRKRKGKERARTPETFSKTDPAPEHGFRVTSASHPINDNHEGIILWREVNFRTFYNVQPSDWEEIKPYSNFVLPPSKNDPFRVGETVYVAKHTTTPDPPTEPAKLDGTPEQSEEYKDELFKYGKRLLQYNKENFWLAKILQIRARTPDRVLVLVAWLYWPEELPKRFQKQPWFGREEVFPSNWMDVIDATTVSDRARIVFLDENKDSCLYEGVDATFQKELAAIREEQEANGRKVQTDDAPPILFWRQTFDARAEEADHKLGYADVISHLRPFCVCQMPNNPDKRMYHCQNKGCLQWNHDDCLADDIGTRALRELTDGQIDQWALQNSPAEAQISIAGRVEEGIKAVGNFIKTEVERIAIDGVGSVQEETAVTLGPATPPEGDDVASSSVATTNNRRAAPKKRAPKTPAWKSKLNVQIVPSIDKPPFARVVEKTEQGRIWELKVHCLSCGDTMD